MFADCVDITNTTNSDTYWIIGTSDCPSSNAIYDYRCMFCHKKYVGKSGTELRVWNNAHKYSINTGNSSSAFFTHLEKLRELNTDLHLPCVEDYY